MQATAQRIEMLDEPADTELAERPTALPLVQQPQQIAPPAGRQLSVVEYAMQNGASAAEVKSLVELQIQMDNHKLTMLKQQDERDREQRKEAAELAFRRDFAAFRGENVIVPKTKMVEQQGREGKAGPKFMQSEFDVVCSMLSPALSRHGFGFRHDMQFGSREWPTAENPHNMIGWVTVTCFLEHRDKHTETLTLEGPPDDSGRKNPLQEMQSTASYLKRQSLLAITGTATGGEDDENAMRRKSTSSDGKALDEDLLDEARSKAHEGWKSLQRWWAALDEKKRTSIMGEFKSLKDAAIKADAMRGGQ